MTPIEINDADFARECVRAGIEFLYYVDGYTIDQLQNDVLDPALFDLEDKDEDGE